MRGMLRRLWTHEQVCLLEGVNAFDKWDNNNNCEISILLILPVYIILNGI
jgi:hypothetical protein